MANPPLGFIVKADRTQEQHDAHDKVMRNFPRFALVGGSNGPPPVGTKVILTDFFKNPDVIADLGLTFTGYRQLTGCVGVSAGDAINCLAAIQRSISPTPTKAILSWWPYPYGSTRYNEGDRGQGEGAIDSVMASTLIKQGVFDIREVTGLPTFNTSDGFAISESQEMQYSDGGSESNTKWSTLAATHPLGGASVCNSVQDIQDSIINGYPILDGCDNYIGNGSLQGSGSDAVCIGAYDGAGGHSTCYIGYWNHASFGPLYLYWNQWSGNTYPQDGSGKVRCSTWVKESTVARLFQTGGGGGETVALSHLNYTPAQPAVLNWTP